MTDYQKISQVLDVPMVMHAWRVKAEDRAFLWGLAEVANDADHFFDMIRRIRKECSETEHSF